MTYTYQEQFDHGWGDREGNYLQESIRWELCAQLAILGIEVTEHQVGRLAWGVATEVDRVWELTPKKPIDADFDPPSR